MPRLFVIKKLERGGAEHYLLRFLKFMNAPDENYVLVASGRKGTLDDDYAHYSMLIYNIKLYDKPVFAHMRLVSFLKQHKIDAVCDFRGNFGAWTMLCARLARTAKRMVFYRESVNKFKPSLLKNAYAKYLTKIVEHSATRILANSEAALDHFHPSHIKHPEKYEVIHNGFDQRLLSQNSLSQMREIFHIQDKAFVIGHAGRLVNAKNHDMIVRCAIEMCKRHTDVYWLLAGRNVDVQYKELVESHQLSDRILLLGERNDVLDLLQALNLFYFPSLTEGQPNALIEAMCSGIPYVASDIASIKETAVEGYGILVPPTSFESNLSALEQMYSAGASFSSALQESAIKTFDVNKLFNRFYHCL